MTKNGKREAKPKGRTSAVGVPKAKQARSPGKPKVARSGAKNEYLQALLDPATGPVVGVPDLVTMRSAKFRTHRVGTLATRPTTGQTAIASAFSPALDSGVVAVGMAADGTDCHLISAAPAGFIPAGSSTATMIDNIVMAADYTSIKANYAAVRPVAFEMVVRYVGPPLTAQGKHGVSLVAGQEYICHPDTALSNTGGISGLGGAGTAASDTVADMLSQCDVCVPTLEPVRVIWCPQDPSDLDYVSTDGLNNNLQNVTTEGWTTQVWANPTLAASCTYVGMPVAISDAAAAAPAGPANTSAATLALSYPYFRWAANGLPANPSAASVVYFEYDLFVVWEAVPRVAIGVGFATTSMSPSNPDELTQATNVMEIIPKATAPTDPTDRGPAVQAAAAQTAGHLYDSTIPRKDAVEGKSILRTLGKAALGFAAPALSAIPGIGGPLSVGASLLASLM